MAELENAQWERFAVEYLKDYNASKAGERAGYTAQYGRMLLQNPTISERIAELRDSVSARTHITAERIAKEYARLAFQDGREPAAILDALAERYTPGELDGADRPRELPLAERLDALPRDVTAAVKEMTARVDSRGNVTYTVKMHDKVRPLEELARRFWTPDEADDELVTGIESLRSRDDVPDMSEDVKTHNTAQSPALEDVPTHPGADSLCGETAELGDATLYCDKERGHDGDHYNVQAAHRWGDSEATWRKNRPRR
jgi:phage terminase small subunit